MSTIDHPPAPKPGIDRRRFLALSGLAAGATVAFVACGSDDRGDTAGTGGAVTSTTMGSTSTTGGSGGQGDLAVAEGAAGLEVLAVNTYGAALQAANAGDLGQVPDAVAEFVTTAKQQHQAALDAWTEVITGGGGSEVTEPPSQLEQTVNEQFAQVTDVAGAAELANMLEQTAAQTYLDAQSVLEGADARGLAGSIQVTAQQRSAVLNFVLGEYPVPEVFQSTEMSILEN